jgi:hypothetical protein
MTPSESLQLAQDMGFTLPSPAYIFGSIVFGLIGLVAWRYGKVVQHPRMRWLGVVLMFYPYVVGETWLLYVVGCGICAYLWWDRPSR